MKFFLFITLLISNLTFCQTKKETVEFLNLKLNSCRSSMSDRLGEDIPAIYTLNNPSNVSVKFELTIGNPFEVIMIYPLSVIDIIEERAPNGNLNLKIITENKTITSWFVSDQIRTLNSEMKLVLNCPDEDIRKIKKALKHLFVLNGAKLVNEKLF